MRTLGIISLALSLVFGMAAALLLQSCSAYKEVKPGMYYVEGKYEIKG